MIADALIGRQRPTAEPTAQLPAATASASTASKLAPSICHVSFTLLSADPANVNTSWNIGSATELYLEPLRRDLDGQSDNSATLIPLSRHALSNRGSA